MESARGLWFVTPRAVEIRKATLPPMADGDVLVRTSCSGISAGTEMLAYRGQIPTEVPLDETIEALDRATFRYPFQYGYSCVGVVEGSRSDIAVGSVVFAFHPHQDRFVASARDVVPLDGVSPRIAVLFPLVETALQISLDAGPLLAEEVVLFGLGPVGVLTSVMLQRAGAIVIGADPLRWRREAAAAMGVTAVSPDDVAAALSTSTGRDGVSLVIEASGQPEALASGLKLLAHEGTALVASWYGSKEVTLPLGAEFHRRRLTIRSTQVSTIPAHLSSRWTRDRRRSVTARLLGSLELGPIATHTFPFDSAAQAFRAVDDGAPGLVHAALGYE
jgi:2-desacetyl-2-hydroxyethyl bacteriochlorophyllide A dehydrogenase